MVRQEFYSNPEERKSQSRQRPIEPVLSQIFFEAVPDAMVAVDREGVILQVNSQTERMFGYKQKELLGQPVEMLVPAARRERHSQHREHYREKPAVRRMGAELELRGRRKDGTEFPVEISLSPVPSDQGLLVLSAIRDVTDRKRMEEQLKKAHELLAASKDREIADYRNRLALIVDSSQDAIIGKDLDGTITHWNKGAEHIYGYAAEEVVGKPISLLAPKDRPDEITGILRKIRRGELVESFETVRIRKDGKLVQVSVSVSPIRDAQGEIVGASAIARDVTGQRQTEEMLRQAQKMEAIGRLAGGVAHDFNNVLGIITSSCELLRGQDEAHSNSPYVANIREAANRGAALTRQLLAFTRKQSGLRPVVLDLNECLKSIIKLLRPLMGDDVGTTVRLSPEPPILEMDPAQLDQIVMNIAVNARDAMPNGGTLLLETAVKELDADFAERHPPLKPGRHVQLTIGDTGTGMDAETLARIFEPFFSTKEVGKGTGLGMSTVYGIVTQVDGHIWIYSEPGRGTSVKVYLPSAEHRLESPSRYAAEDLPPKVKGKTVLLVEDDPLMRSSIKAMLQQHGYAVVEAPDGKSALDLMTDGSLRVEVLLSDVMMPGLTGPELALRLREIRPEVKVVLMSGYPGEILAKEGQAGSDDQLLEKPFTKVALLKALQAVLS